ncbi:MAG: bifunctional hydroxymethylpyrimidine kinase/phosphomethylpyrimidine kinase [Nitrospirales bacterium]|nr:bifunctional hydroxymethylpyrimidine kinase/phosphomethylpyrimidine kinase [Nitrospirales bacterium]
MSPHVALTIAGSDPTGGAGLQADLRVFSLLGVYGLSAVSALTAQNTFEVTGILPVDGRFLEAQLNTLISDIRPDALKTGMLFSGDVVRSVARIVRGFELENLVIDPVTVSSTGSSLLEEGALEILTTELFPLSRVITPNIYEASAISGVAIEDEEGMENAARRLKELGPEVVIITGGHFPGRGGQETMELIYDGASFLRIEGKKMKGEYHGTGCAYSAAITANLAKGLSVPEAARRAKELVESAIRQAYRIGKGMSLLKFGE